MQAPGPDVSPPEIAGERCVHARIERGSCRACVVACPREALRLDEESLELDLEACDGCGLCVAACPTAAIALDLPAMQEQGRRGARMLLACEHRATRQGQGVMPCVHALGVRQLLGLYRQGVRALVVSIGDCDDCARGSGARLADQLARVNQMLASRGMAVMDLRAVTGEEWRSRMCASTGTRRGRWRFLRSAWAVAAADRGPATAPGALLPAVSEADVMPHVPAFDARRCHGCDACIRLCPEGALSYRVVDATGYYHSDPARCSGCGICTDVCESGGIRLLAWQAGVPSAMALAAGRCRACGVTFHHPAAVPDDGGLCRICMRVNHYRNLHQVQDAG